MHAQTDAKEGNAVLPGVTDGGNLPFQAPGTKAGGHQDAVHARELFRDVLRREVIGLNGDHVYLTAVGGSGMHKAFLDALVGVLQLHIFSYQGNLDLCRGVLQTVQEGA